jgi:hypothetical protein
MKISVSVSQDLWEAAVAAANSSEANKADAESTSRLVVLALRVLVRSRLRSPFMQAWLAHKGRRHADGLVQLVTGAKPTSAQFQGAAAAHVRNVKADLAYRRSIGDQLGIQSAEQYLQKVRDAVAWEHGAGSGILHKTGGCSLSRSSGRFCAPVIRAEAEAKLASGYRWCQRCAS